MAQFYGHHSKEYIRSFSPEVGVLVSAGITPLGGGSLAFPGEKDAANPTFRHATFSKAGMCVCVCGVYERELFLRNIIFGEGGGTFLPSSDLTLRLSSSHTLIHTLIQCTSTHTHTHTHTHRHFLRHVVLLPRPLLRRARLRLPHHPTRPLPQTSEQAHKTHQKTKMGQKKQKMGARP